MASSVASHDVLTAVLLEAKPGKEGFSRHGPTLVLHSTRTQRWEERELMFDKTAAVTGRTGLF